LEGCCGKNRILAIFTAQVFYENLPNLYSKQLTRPPWRFLFTKNPGKPFHDELLFAKGIIHLQKAAVQKIMQKTNRILNSALIGFMIKPRGKL
jgi:hypothetical protein